MRVCRKYYSDLTLRAQVRSEGMAKVLQFKATVWPKVAPDRARKLKKFKNFLGEHPSDLPSCFCISVLQATESWAGPGYEALASAVLWLRHWYTSFKILCNVISYRIGFFFRIYVFQQCD